MGDVLRSTALLPPLAEAHPRAAITWITRQESVPLLQRESLHRRGAGARTGGAGALADADVRPRHQSRCVEDQRRAGDGGASRSGKTDLCWTSADTCSRPTTRRGGGWRRDLRRHQASGHCRPTRTAWPRSSVLDGQPASVRVRARATKKRRRAPTGHLESIGIEFEPPVDWPEYRRRRTLAAQAVARGRLRRADRRDLAASRDVQFLLLGGPQERERNERLKAASRVSDSSTRAATIRCVISPRFSVTATSW